MPILIAIHDCFWKIASEKKGHHIWALFMNAPPYISIYLLSCCAVNCRIFKTDWIPFIVEVLLLSVMN